MSISPIPPINLQQIAAGTEAVSQNRQLRGEQGEAATVSQQATAAQAALAMEAESVARTEETRKSHDQQQSGERDTSRRQQRHRDDHRARQFFVPDDEDEGSHVDIEA